MNHKCRLLKGLIRYAVLSSFTALFAQNTTVKPQPEIHVISSRPEFVSGSSTLIEVKASTASGWRVSVNGTDETGRFRPANEASRYLAVITGLKSGPNTVQLEQQGTVVSTMKIDNHPTTGPLFSGPHQQPLVCQTEASGLGPATDADCDVPTIVNYYYKSTDVLPPLYTIEKASALGPGFKTYNPSAPPPVDIAETRTFDGQTVPFIVRRETGVINRAAYDIEFLYRPGQSLPSPWERPNTGWNGRLVYLVGGGAAPGYLQGTLGDSVGSSRAAFLSRGYAVASATLSNFGVTANDRVGAETVSMVKEYFIKQYGPPAHTIGWGGSGGAMEQHLIVQNYPGLLDGIITYLSYPDYVTSVQSATDCQLLYHAFDKSSVPWGDEQKSAVSGFATWKTCEGWGVNDKRWKIQDPQGPCPEELPKASIYDRSTNPRGTRCDFYSTWITILGIDPKTGHAYRPLDNLGVQYGLVAFNRGLIDAEHFIELNERIGGFDDDGAVVPARSEAPPQALRNAYERGLVFSGSGGAGDVPIVDWRQYGDDLENQHDSFRSFAARQRLRKANGTADNQVILVAPRWTPTALMAFTHVGGFEAIYEDQIGDLVHHMDQWLDAIGRDKGNQTASIKVSRNKPRDLVDGCWTIDGHWITEERTYGGAGQCNQLYPPYGDPRIAAGGPIADDLLKCAVKPFDSNDYDQPLTTNQIERLKKIFARGVCDYSKPGVEQGPIKGTWQTF